MAPGFLAGSGASPDSAFLVSFCFAAAASPSSLGFFGPDFAWAFGVGDSSGCGVGVFFGPGFFFGFADSFDLAFFFFNLAVASLSFAPGFFIPDFALLFGAGDSSGPGVRLFLAAGVAVGSGDSPDSVEPIRFGLAVDSFSSSLDFLIPDFALFFGKGDSSGSGEGVFLAAGVALPFGFAAGRFLALALRFAGFCFAPGSGVCAGVGEAVVSNSSPALARAGCFLFCSSVSSAFTKVATIALRARTVPKKMRERITGPNVTRSIRQSSCSRKLSEFGLKRAVASRSGHRRPAPAPGEESHSIFHPRAKANRSNTSRSSA